MKTIVSFLALCATAQMAWAANGNLLIGISPSSNAQGGTGVASSTTTIDAIHKNPANLAGQMFGADRINAELVTNFYKQGPTANAGAGATASLAGVVVLPSIGVSYQINENWTFGLGALAYGGGIADYSNLTTVPGNTLGGIQTKHELLKIQPGVSYRANEWLSIGFAPIMNYSTLVTNEATSGTQSVRSSDGRFGIGAQTGITLKPAKGLDIGFTYSTRSKMTFQNMIDFTLLSTNGATAGGLNPITVTQPTEVAAGVGYVLTDDWKVAFDWRYIGWRGAAGYGDLGWADQHVFALGTQYKLNKLALRGGFNYGKNPIESRTGINGAAGYNFQGTTLPTVVVDRLNLIAFPAFAQSHFTFGAGYPVSDAFDLDLAFMYAPKVTTVRSGTVGATAYALTTEVTQWSVSAGGSYRF